MIHSFCCLGIKKPVFLCTEKPGVFSLCDFFVSGNRCSLRGRTLGLLKQARL
jgi:hypothetical protein